MAAKKKKKKSPFEHKQLWYEIKADLGGKKIQGFSQNTHILLKEAEPVPPLKDCIQAAACYGGMHVGKQASKKVAPLKQNITPPTTDDTPLFTHSLAPRICFTLTFIFQGECFKLHSLKSRDFLISRDSFMHVDIDIAHWKKTGNKPFNWLFFLMSDEIYCMTGPQVFA